MTRETTVSIRPMDDGDVARVAEIDLLAFGSGGWPASAFSDELHRNRMARYFVLDAGGAEPLQGYVGCWALFDAVHIVTIAVDPRYQRRGLGELLVQRALDLASETGAPEVTLECRESNEAALALYHKYAFKQVARRRRYYSDNREDALVMTAHDVGQTAYRETLERLRAQHRKRYGLAVSALSH